MVPDSALALRSDLLSITVVRAAPLFLLLACTANAQSWPQWGQNPQHTGAVRTAGQKPDSLLGQFTYDPLADQIRGNGDLLVHYMAPLVDGDEIFTMSRGDSQWISCLTNLPPCGTQRWPQMQWGVTKLRSDSQGLEPQWTVLSSWTPPPDNGSGWEPVFHPALSGKHLYVPAGSGMVMKLDRKTGEQLDCFKPFGDDDPNMYVSSPLTIDAQGSLYYTAMKLDPAAPWTQDVQEAWLVKVDARRTIQKVSFSDLVPGAPSDACVTSFSTATLPWPPAPDAVPPTAPCGSQRPGLNVAPAIDGNGTIYVVSRAHFNPAYAYLIAVHRNLTLKWDVSLRNHLNDGCDILLPQSGTLGGCRAGSTPGVDPATNQLPAGNVMDQSTASPVITPDGSILFGVYNRYNYARGHMLHFSRVGEFLNSYDFGWDITPGIYAHDGTWSAIIKDNHYPVGSYCGTLGQCGQGDEHYSLTSLGPNMQTEWSYENTNDQSCQRSADGTITCTTTDEKFEWCVNMVAVDRDGVVYANSEDGNVYAIDRTGTPVGHVFLKLALGAAYTPLSIGPDGRVYTQNDGTLFVTGAADPARPGAGSVGHH